MPLPFTFRCPPYLEGLIRFFKPKPRRSQSIFIPPDPAVAEAKELRREAALYAKYPTAFWLYPDRWTGVEPRGLMRFDDGKPKPEPTPELGPMLEVMCPRCFSYRCPGCGSIAAGGSLSGGGGGQATLSGQGPKVVNELAYRKLKSLADAAYTRTRQGRGSPQRTCQDCYPGDCYSDECIERSALVSARSLGFSSGPSYRARSLSCRMLGRHTQVSAKRTFSSDGSYFVDATCCNIGGFFYP